MSFQSTAAHSNLKLLVCQSISTAVNVCVLSGHRITALSAEAKPSLGTAMCVCVWVCVNYNHVYGNKSLSFNLSLYKDDIMQHHWIWPSCHDQFDSKCSRMIYIGCRHNIHDKRAARISCSTYAHQQPRVVLAQPLS